MDGATQLVGVIGWPIEHSLSPAMHNAVLEELGLNWCYVPLLVRPTAVAEAIRGVTALGFRGINVTVPHKQAVMGELDEIAPGAAAVGAVNTVVIDGDAGGTHLAGHNTDVPGFITSLRARGYKPAPDDRAVVVGAGGAARAVVYALLTAGIGEVVILNRTLERAQRLIVDLTVIGTGTGRLKALPLQPAALVAVSQEAQLLVNATTVGMWPSVADSIWPADVPLPGGLVVYDLVYNPLETRLLRQARCSGAQPLDGLDMLARQGALALALWLEEALDVDWATALMRDVCERALGSRA